MLNWAVNRHSLKIKLSTFTYINKYVLFIALHWYHYLNITLKNNQITLSAVFPSYLKQVWDYLRVTFYCDPFLLSSFFKFFLCKKMIKIYLIYFSRDMSFFNAICHGRWFPPWKKCIIRRARGIIFAACWEFSVTISASVIWVELMEVKCNLSRRFCRRVLRPADGTKGPLRDGASAAAVGPATQFCQPCGKAQQR